LRLTKERKQDRMSGPILSIAAAALALGATFLDVVAAQSGSSRPIRVIVPAAAGGAIEPYARLISEHMGKTLGRAMVIENKPGANGNLAAQFALEAPADGSLLLVGTQSMSEINSSTFRELKWSMADFTPLIRGVVAPLVLVVHPSVPARTLPALVDWIKGNPGKLSYSSYNPGTPSHFLGYQMNERFGLDLAHVPYRGSGPQTADLIAGHALLGFSQLETTLPQISAGRLHAIATTGPARSRFLPNVPTFAELGYPEFTASIWFGLMIRAATAATVVDAILNAAKAAHADPDVRSKLEAQGYDVSGQSGPDFAADIKAQAERWARLVKASGFKADGQQ
jgi:tripartite-type tricarboxylate transporter receptor subunit TctC